MWCQPVKAPFLLQSTKQTNKTKQKNPALVSIFWIHEPKHHPSSTRETFISGYYELTLVLVHFAGWRVILFQSTSSQHHLYLSSELIPNQNERWITPRQPPCSQLMSSMADSINWLSLLLHRFGDAIFFGGGGEGPGNFYLLNLSVFIQLYHQHSISPKWIE